MNTFWSKGNLILIYVILCVIFQNKYFDSGDYNMAKAKKILPQVPMNSGGKLLIGGSTGETIPTPESLPPRKPSIGHSKLAEMSSWKHHVNRTMPGVTTLTDFMLDLQQYGTGQL